MSEEFNILARSVAESRDVEAFKRLFAHFAPRVKGYLVRMHLGEEMAEDVTQEVMSQLWHKAHMFDPAKASLSTWLFRIARNRMIDMKRRDRSGQLDVHDPFFQPAAEEEPDGALTRQQEETKLRALLSGLPEEQRQLLLFSFFEGLSHGQIAEATGQPLGTVKSRIRLALVRLRKEMEGGEAGERLPSK